MTAAVVDLVAVMRARAELVALVAAHPELTQPAARERLAAALPDLMEYDVSQPLDPNQTGTATTVGVRLPPDLLAAVDAEVVRLRAVAPGSSFGRSDAVRSLLLRALSATSPTPVGAAPVAVEAPAVVAPATPAKRAQPRLVEPPADASKAAHAMTAAQVRKRLETLRAADPKGWSLRATAERAGTSTNPIEKILSGGNVSPEYVAKIAATLPRE